MKLLSDVTLIMYIGKISRIIGSGRKGRKVNEYPNSYLTGEMRKLLNKIDDQKTRDDYERSLFNTRSNLKAIEGALKRKRMKKNRATSIDEFKRLEGEIKETLEDKEKYKTLEEGHISNIKTLLGIPEKMEKIKTVRVHFKEPEINEEEVINKIIKINKKSSKLSDNDPKLNKIEDEIKELGQLIGKNNLYELNKYLKSKGKPATDFEDATDATDIVHNDNINEYLEQSNNRKEYLEGMIREIRSKEEPTESDSEKLVEYLKEYENINIANDEIRHKLTTELESESELESELELESESELESPRSTSSSAPSRMSEFSTLSKRANIDKKQIEEMIARDPESIDLIEKEIKKGYLYGELDRDDYNRLMSDIPSDLKDIKVYSVADPTKIITTIKRPESTQKKLEKESAILKMYKDGLLSREEFNKLNKLNKKDNKKEGSVKSQYGTKKHREHLIRKKRETAKPTKSLKILQYDDDPGYITRKMLIDRYK